MSSAPRGSQLSGSTAYAGSTTSLSSLGSAATVVPAQNGGPVMATSNIINQKADASRSLYQICVSLKQRLSQVPDFAPFLDQLDPSDPVDPLWNLLRTGYPLLTIYNSLQPTEPLKVEDTNASEAKKSKIAVFKFVQACMKELQVPPAQSFVITDLMGTDTSGFVKVIQVVHYVLDLAEQRGLLLQLQPYPEDEQAAATGGSQMSYRDHIVKELVDTERKYVQDLENLHDLKKMLEQKGLIPGDVVHQIFLNINAILDFQRRFLIRVETTNSMPKAVQRWGAPFCFYEDSFDIYQPFIANQRKAAQIANLVFDKIQQSDHPVAADFNTLDGFLLKPMQRLVKYPLLLKDLAKKSEDEEVKDDLCTGCDAAERVLFKANEAVNRDLLDESLEELITRVDDWKSHKVESFGKLLLHGVYGVTTGKNEQEKDIWWKGDPGVENFTIKFLNEETMRKWAAGLETQRKENAPRLSTSQESIRNDFAWTRDHAGGLENPYLQQEDDDEDYGGPATAPAQMQMSSQSMGSVVPRTSSNGSLRQRSATGESTQSLASIARAPPPRFPPPMPPSSSLSIQTASSTGAQSPGSRGGDSYFSPVPESPASSRTSTTSGIFPGPAYQFSSSSKAGTPQPVWDDSRYGPGGMPRAPSRDGSSPNPLGMGGGGRAARGPSLPVMATHSQTAAQQQRSRSYSTPDANVAGMPRQRQPSQSNIPAVPGIPQHLHPAALDGNISRSQTGSPRNDLPIRTSTQSPGAQRERMHQHQHQHQHSGSLGGSTMSAFPSQPAYSRGNTPVPNGVNSIRADAAAPAANSRNASPSIGAGGTLSHNGSSLASPDLPMPTQLKVRVNCDSGNYVTLVVAFNITYQSLIDRIDAKLARFMTNSISKGALKLRYRDEDGDFITIESDDDIQIAFTEWHEGVRNMYSGGVGEIELFCVGEGQ
ncbi:hypothetical protein UVI_02014570 [Ustilaginoidea virens]|uniref:Uncharacterized protein n=1 Tax=Ustilaginoidea virens TaxID=1159556 RepID=A0A1B5L7B7_USTVR|nr:hypothetical protein UVI_02014570 [Ustilaginoidea virens]